MNVWSGEIFYSMNEARVVIEQWRKFYNTTRRILSVGLVQNTGLVISTRTGYL